MGARPKMIFGLALDGNWERLMTDKPALGDHEGGTTRKPVVLFLCTNNSVRSQMAEAFLKKYASHHFEVVSAGLEPTSINPLTTRVMNEIGIDISAQYSKSVSQFLGQVPVSLVIFVCEHAEKSCPTAWPGAFAQMSWPFDDPACCQGTEEERLQRFRHVRDQVHEKINSWLREMAQHGKER
jgi:arsenate reductase